MSEPSYRLEMEPVDVSPGEAHLWYDGGGASTHATRLPLSLARKAVAAEQLYEALCDVRDWLRAGGPLTADKANRVFDALAKAEALKAQEAGDG